MNPVEQRVSALGASAWMQKVGRQLRAYEKKAIDGATLVCCGWAKELASSGRYDAPDEEFIQKSHEYLVNHIRQTQYSGLFAPIVWVVVSAVISFFVEWFLRWLFSSVENYQAVIGLEMR